MDERWMPVLGYEGLYEVSDLGRVKRVRKGPKTYPGLIIKGLHNGRGYFAVGLHGKGKVVKRTIHKMVWEAFNHQVPPGMEINHEDGNKLNNHLGNLTLMTPKQNSQHAYRTGLSTGPRGEKNRHAKLTADDVRAIRSGVQCYGYQAAMGRKYGIAASVISKILRGKNWKHV